VFASGFTVVAIACLINAQLTSAWAGDNFLISQMVLGFGFALSFTALVGSFVQNAFDTGALSSPINLLTYSSFIHCTRLFGGEAGTAIMQRLISVREQFHSNMLGLHVEGGNWLTTERVGLLAQALFPGSAGTEEAQARAAQILGGQVRLQAYTLAYSDAYLAIAFAAALGIVLIAFMKPMKIYFDSTSASQKK
jgi:DHA2 family multidrug resistance protein